MRSPFKGSKLLLLHVTRWSVYALRPTPIESESNRSARESEHKEMLRNAASKVMWVGRATVFLVGLAVIVALLFGVASMALARDGQSFILGQRNVAQSLSTLVRQEAGPALSLQVDSGAPLAVNSESRVDNLNADELDGKNASEIGVNGLERVVASSDTNSNSPKDVVARCPSGKILVGTGFDIAGGKSGTSPNTQTDVVVDAVIPGTSAVIVEAYEERLMSANWLVTAHAICATAP
jgi:hypothetical protein